jgi:hypothetical protein
MLKFQYETQHFNAQGSIIIIVVVKIRAVKIYAATVEALRKNGRQDE